MLIIWEKRFDEKKTHQLLQLVTSTLPEYKREQAVALMKNADDIALGLSVAKAKKQKHDWVRALVMPKKTKKSAKSSTTTKCKRKPASSACEGQQEAKQPCTGKTSEEEIEEEAEASGNTQLDTLVDEESSDGPPEESLFDP